jgi:hypothetical protein
VAQNLNLIFDFMLMSYGVLLLGMWKCANKSYTYLQILYKIFFIFSRLSVTKDGVRIDNCLY